MSYGVGRRFGLDPVLLWLWGRSAAAAPIRPLAWELPCAALKSKKKKVSEQSLVWLPWSHIRLGAKHGVVQRSGSAHQQSLWDTPLLEGSQDH